MISQSLNIDITHHVNLVIELRKQASIFRKGILIAFASTLLLTTVLAIRLTWQTESSKTWYVGPPPSDFTKIQDAIDNDSVSDGDIIEVKWNATPYYENVTVYKSLAIRVYEVDRIRGDYPTVDGGNNKFVFNITATEVEIDGFIIRNGEYGIYLASNSAGSYILNNTVQSNTCGIYIESANNTLLDNKMAANNRNLNVVGSFFTQNITSSNMVDGKPVYYWVNEHDKSIPTDAGYVALINCTNITVRDLASSLRNNVEGVFVLQSTNVTLKSLNLRYNDFGISFASSTNSTIENVTIQDCGVGIYLLSSDNNTIHGNIATSYSGWGILLFNSHNNAICGNTARAYNDLTNYAIELDSSSSNIITDNAVSNSSFGIYTTDSSYNTFVGNNVSLCTCGIVVEYSNNNTFYHNNIMNNTNPKWSVASINAWDNGAEGNYWTDYSGKDDDKDGIGDTPYIFENVDNHPLIRPWNPVRILNITLDGSTQYLITIHSDHVIASVKFYLCYDATMHESYVYFNVTAGSSGYCNVTIPRDRLDYPFHLIANNSIVYTSTCNETHCTLSLTYSEGKYMVKIIGDRVGTIYGDINCDGIVNMRDIGIACYYFGQNANSPPIEVSEDP